MSRSVFILFAHDLAVAFKNKTVYLIVGIPLFVYATLALVDPGGDREAQVKIAWLRTESYPYVAYERIRRAPDWFDVRWAADEAEATRWLKDREVDGFLSPVGPGGSRLRLTVARQASVEALEILRRFTALQPQPAAKGRAPDWITEVHPLQTGSVQRQTLPTWILMMVLLVGFIVLPAQVAEEKEKQLLLGWMQTPVRESEWLASKLAYGLVLMLASVAALQGMVGELTWAVGAGGLVMLLAGGFCFGALGICLGLLCRNQASARTLGVLCYLPLLLPAALSDMSRELRAVAPWIPSYQLVEPIRAMLLDNSGLATHVPAGLLLVAIGGAASFASHRLLKKRWLM
jgi:ABC-2 type transport system permease protein